MSEPPIRVESVTKTFDGGRVVAVDNISFDVQAGEIVGLVGINGAGKTTLLRMLAGILPVTQGTIAIAGHTMTPDAVEARRALAFVADTPSLFDSLTVYEHLLFTAELYGVEDRESKIDAVLADFALIDKRNALASSLSRGMRQKVMICCGLLHAPTALLLDEPLSGLDPLGRKRMSEAIEAAAERGAAVLISSHQMEFVQKLSHRFIILHNGRVHASGTRADVEAGLTSLEDILIRASEDDAS